MGWGVGEGAKKVKHIPSTLNNMRKGESSKVDSPTDCMRALHYT